MLYVILGGNLLPPPFALFAWTGISISVPMYYVRTVIVDWNNLRCLVTVCVMEQPLSPVVRHSHSSVFSWLLVMLIINTSYACFVFSLCDV
jgi:hypothetical protein